MPDFDQLDHADEQGLSEEEIDACQERLCRAGMACIPLSYVNFLLCRNGMRTDDFVLFGIYENPSFFERDIFYQNSFYGQLHQCNRLFLGSNASCWLCYDWTEKQFLLIDKETAVVCAQKEFFDAVFPIFSHPETSDNAE
jgi:hypothetical protein